MNQNFVRFIKNYADKKLAVAVSGGVDSICLLCWLAELKLDIVALHVNHGLRAVAEEETQYVRDLCARMNIPCKIFYWAGDKPVAGLEAAARDARYKFMTDFCQENNIDALLIAHQADDQIETFLMNLARGSGLYGLSAMQAQTYRDGVKIVRPLLNVSRAELQKYCDDNNIKYFHDEMNNDPQYTRVRIRQNRHLLNDALGISDSRILLAIQNLGRARDATDKIVSDLIEQVRNKNCVMFSDSFLFDLALEIRLRFLGRVFQIIGGNVYPPRLDALARAVDRLQSDCKFTLAHCTVRRLGDKIMVVPEGEKTSFRKRLRKYEKHKQETNKK